MKRAGSRKIDTDRKKKLLPMLEIGYTIDAWSGVTKNRTNVIDDITISIMQSSANSPQNGVGAKHRSCATTHPSATSKKSSSGFAASPHVAACGENSSCSSTFEPPPNSTAASHFMSAVSNTLPTSTLCTSSLSKLLPCRLIHTLAALTDDSCLPENSTIWVCFLTYCTAQLWM